MFIESIIIISLQIVFMYGAMQEGEILFPFRKLLENIVSKFPVSWQFYLRKPLFDCLFCMSSFWGITFAFLPLPWWLNIIFCVAGLNYLWSAFIGYLHAAKDATEEKQAEINAQIKDLEKRIFPLG